MGGGERGRVWGGEGDGGEAIGQGRGKGKPGAAGRGRERRPIISGATEGSIIL